MARRRLGKPAVFALVAALTAAAAPASAAQYWTKTRIVGISAVTVDPDHPAYRNIFWIGMADDAWLPEKCRKLPGLIFPDHERAMVMLAVRAYERGETVVVKADDGAMIGEYCRLFQITLPADPKP
ncbi:hypothetical protein [Sphingosinicella xenopeptidilytica]|uniref:Uncharacterized protein n=1 Tax=Sphingosinicella xenopeptidilytica TaxID=364098 RepID=A0ABW3BYM0_SPHXN